ncbi:16S rRNA (uracil(1498)-N(3))-methyltransferase [soil metagenome]
MKDAPRVYVDLPLAAGAEHALSREQAHYLRDVMRVKPGDPVRLFNGCDGEFLAFAGDVGRKGMTVRLERLVAEAAPPPDIDFLFAPLKHARLDYIVQKATELGARRIRPVLTRRTIVRSVNLERMRANAIEAAEQCNLVFVPEVADAVPLERVLGDWPRDRALIHCDEAAPEADAIAALKGLSLPAAVLIGPEGGFDPEERAQIASLPQAVAISLGPRIIRADTAGVAALTLVQAVLGDWHDRP